MKRVSIYLLAMLLSAACICLHSSTEVCAAEAKYDFQLDHLTSRADVTMAKLSDKPLIVYVWAPDCPHCKRNMPFVKSVVGKVDRASVNFVACSMGSQPETRDYVDEHELDFDVLYKGHSQDFISASFTDDGWPTSFVFAPGGELIGTCDAQGIEYETTMLELIGKAVARMPKAETPATEDAQTEDPNTAETQPAPHKVAHWWEKQHSAPEHKDNPAPKVRIKGKPKDKAEDNDNSPADPDSSADPKPDEQD